MSPFTKSSSAMISDTRFEEIKNRLCSTPALQNLFVALHPETVRREENGQSPVITYDHRIFIKNQDTTRQYAKRIDDKFEFWGYRDLAVRVVGREGIELIMDPDEVQSHRHEKQLKRKHNVSESVIQLRRLLKEEVNQNFSYQSRVLTKITNDEDSKSPNIAVAENDILDQDGDIVIVGEPGIGKTTLLKSLAIHAIDSGVTPILINLSIPRNKGVESLIKQILYQSNKQGLKVSENELLTKDHVILMDGLEFSSPKTIEDIIELKGLNTKTKLIVSCRINHSYAALNFSNILRLENFSETAISEIISELNLSSSDITIDTDIIRNPYQMKMLAQITQHSDSEISISNESQLFEKFIERHLSEERSKREGTALYSNSMYAYTAEKLGALSYLAFCMQKQAQPVKISYQKAENLLRDCLSISSSPQDIDRIFPDLMLEGLVVRNGDFLEFTHDLLREFLCARHLWKILGVKDGWKELLENAAADKQKLPNPNWEKVIFNFVELLEDATSVVESIRSGDIGEETIFFDNIGLAMMCIGKSKYIDLSLVREIINEALIEYEHTDSDFRKRTLLRKISWIRNRNILGILEEYLDYPDENVRDMMTSILSQSNTNESIEIFMKRVQNPDPVEKERSINSLVKTGSDRSVKDLLSLLDQEDLDIYRLAIQALGKLDTAKTHQAIISELFNVNKEKRGIIVELLNDVDLGLDDVAAKHLGKESFFKTINSLEKELEGLLFSITDSAWQGISRSMSSRRLVRLLKDSDPEVKQAAVNVLACLEEEETVGELKEALAQETNFRNRQSIYAAIGWIDYEALIEILFEDIHHPELSIRECALFCLGILKEERAYEHILPFLNDNLPSTREKAMYALRDLDSFRNNESMIKRFVEDFRQEPGNANLANFLLKFDDEKTALYLTEIIDEKNSEFCRSCIDFLQEKGFQETSVNLFAKVLRFSDQELRDQAICSLFKSEKPSAIEILIAHYHRDEGSQQAILTHLPDHVDYDIAKSMIENFNSFPSNIQQAIRIYLADEYEDKNAEALSEFLNCGIERFRIWAIQTLTSYSKEDLPVVRLIECLDSDPKLCQFIIQALGKTKNIKAIEPLIRKLESNNSGVVRETINALTEILCSQNISDQGVLDTLHSILGEILFSDDHDILHITISALGCLRTPEACSLLKEKLRYTTDNDVETCQKLIYALGSYDEEEVRELLLQKLASDNAEICSCAQHILVSLRASEAEDGMIRFLADDSLGITEVKSKSQVLHIESDGKIFDPFSTLRGGAVVGMYWIGTDKCLKSLCKILSTDLNPNLRERVFGALEKVSERSRMRVIETMLQKN